ncbi:hypothetical protein dsx2_2895 [Desulfovibrio sp. X2]|uniref:hypothetical protein n=1 Tax=Desulfovibrio sp. X2 TaxID=941449 RepID=UPI0003586FDE|nr:hypothetical protein [Desulfovibrio sp. X2]EPR42108.1 hypothetical protein dsx2_2895 [Desulfovibrio sp. X2]
MHLTSNAVDRCRSRLCDMTESCGRLCAVTARTVHASRFLLHAMGKSRRFLLVHFRKGYVREQLHVREGGCRQCGTCCNLLVTCPMLTTQRTCLAYGTCRPQACKVFPIDQRDIDEVTACGGRCGYNFGTPPSPPLRDEA